MATEVKVPTTGNAGEPAVILEWNVAVGDNVVAGDVVATLETAKATVEVDAPVGGVVLDLRYAVGDEVPEYDVLLVIGSPGETTSVPVNPTELAATARIASSSVAEFDSAGEPRVADANRRISISPRARRLAQDGGFDIEKIVGSGPFGRIVIADIVALSKGAAKTPPIVETPPTIERTPVVESFEVAESLQRHRPGRLFPVRGARKVTAQRMQASLQNTAQVTLTRYASADALLAFADRLRTANEARGVSKIGVNDLLLFAVARTVGRHPSANSWFSWDGITQFDHVDLGFAVDTGQALLVPVIRDAESLTLSQLASQAHAAIDRARDGKISLDEMDGGTFTVSNLGGAGIHWFTPVLNTPQSCILGIGAAHRAYADAPALLPLSLTFDHRAIDGSAAAVLLADIATSIEFIDTLTAF